MAENITTPNAVGGIPKGTTVGELKGKTLIDIVDILRGAKPIQIDFLELGTLST